MAEKDTEGKDGREEKTTTDLDVEPKGLNFDEALEMVGGFGRWQVRSILLCSMLWAFGGLAVTSWTFTAYNMRHRCRVPVCEDEDGAEYGNDTFAHLLPPDDVDGAACTYYRWERQDRSGVTCREYEEAVTAAIVSAAATDSAETAATDVSVAGCHRADLLLDRSVVQSSLSVDFDLTCDRLHLRNHLATTYMFGMLVGSLVIGYFSDRFGRLPASVLALLLVVVSGVAGPFVPTWKAFGVTRFLCGVGGVAVYMCSFVFAVENTSPKYAGCIGILSGIPFALGEMVFGLEAYLIRDWKTLQLAVFAPLATGLAIFLLVPESARWLLATGKRAKAIKVLKVMASTNGNRGEHVDERLLWLDFGNNLEETKPKHFEDNSGLGLLAILKERALLWRLANMLFQWISTAFCYYGLVFASTSLTGNPYQNFVLGAIIEIPGYLFTAFVMDCWGRRPILVFLQVLPGLSCIAAGLMQGQESLQVPQLLCCLLGKFGSSGCFCLVFVYTAELFPTRARNSVVGFCSMFARVGTVLSMEVELLGAIWAPLPMVTLGSLATVAGTLAVALPETTGLPIPDNIEEAVELGKGDGACLFSCGCHPERCPISRKRSAIRHRVTASERGGGGRRSV